MNSRLLCRLFPPGSRLRNVLLAALSGALLTGGAASAARALLRPSPEDWVCSQFCRTAQQARTVRALERAFRTGCSPECTRMCAAEENLRTLMRNACAITPEIKAAVEAAARARSEANLAVLQHVHAVAEALPEDRRGDYLRAVLPSVAECCCTP